MSFSYEYPRPALTVDCVVFGVTNLGDPGSKQGFSPELRVLLVKRGQEPYLGQWALPGGFVHAENDPEHGIAPDRTVEDAARRELKEEAGIEPARLEQLGCFGDLNRDPRGRVVTVAYLAVVKASEFAPLAGSDAAEAEWFAVPRHDESENALFAGKPLPKRLAFDHARIIEAGLARLKDKAMSSGIVFDFLPAVFTLRQLQAGFECLLGSGPLDKSNFRKKVLQSGMLKELEQKEEGVSHRAAAYYALDREGFEQKLVERRALPF